MKIVCYNCYENSKRLAQITPTEETEYISELQPLNTAQLDV